MMDYNEGKIWFKKKKRLGNKRMRKGPGKRNVVGVVHVKNRE